MTAAVLALAAQVWLFHDVRYDDPFITYRYGQNLATGRGPTFNPGERFLGATSPGHMLVAALVYRGAGLEATPSIMSALGCVAWSAQAVAVYALLNPAFGALSAAIAAVAVELGAARSYQWVSFETNLVAAFALWALVAAQRKRWIAAALCAALACLMRPDAVLLATPLAASCVWQLRARAIAPACAFAAVTAPWVAFAWAYYGSPLPHSAVEKFQKSPLLHYARHTFDLIGKTVVPFASSTAWFVVAWLAVVTGAVLVARRDRGMRIAVVYAVLLLIAYLTLRPVAGHDWHLYPLALLSCVFALVALAQCAQRAGRRALRYVAALALAASVVLGAARTADAARSHHRDFWSGARHATYLVVSEFLRERASPGDHFSSIEVGTLAYYTDLRAYDLGGLVTHLRRTHMVDRPVRWLVLGDKYLPKGPRFPPVAIASKHGFRVSIFHLPEPKTAADREAPP